jgi:SAM-dependent methyltransferase
MSAAERYDAFCQRLYRRAVPWLAPGLRYSQAYYEDALAAAVQPGVRWLDLGCGHHVLPEWRLEQEKRLVAAAGLVVGADRDLPAMRQHRSLRLRVGSDIGQLPFASGSFDVVTANMVVEHLNAPDRQFREIHRVLAPGGRFLFHTGNLYGYYIAVSRLIPEFCKRPLARLLQGRVAEDVYPTCYLANSSGQVKRLAAATGFEAPRFVRFPSSPQTVRLPLLLPVEMLWIRLTMSGAGAGLRTNFIAELRKPQATGAQA